MVIEIRDQVHYRYNNWNALFESETQEGLLHGVESDRKSLRTWGIRLCVKGTQLFRTQNTMNDMGSPVAETGQGQVKRSERGMFSPQFRNSFHGNWKLMEIFNPEDAYHIGNQGTATWKNWVDFPWNNWDQDGEEGGWLPESTLSGDSLSVAVRLWLGM